MFFEGLLDGLDLLRARGQHALLESVKLIEAAPRTHLAQTHEDTTHRLPSTLVRIYFARYDPQSALNKTQDSLESSYLEIECFVAVEDENESTELVAQSLDRFCLARTSGSWRGKVLQSCYSTVTALLQHSNSIYTYNKKIKQIEFCLYFS